jgi:AraC-like DNA-binding protein
MRVVREFPRVPAMVLLSRNGEPSPADILALGNCGVRRIVDVRTPAGWMRLREALSATAPDQQDLQATKVLAADLEGMPADFVRFVEALFASYAGPRTVRSLSNALGVLPSTLMSRFYRAQLPAPKRYLVLAGLVRAARLFENPGLSVADVANHLDHSSPQSFGRHIYVYLGIAAGEFRQRYDGTKMMDRFRAELITPYRGQLASMSPLVMRARGAKARQPVH